MINFASASSALWWGGWGVVGGMWGDVSLSFPGALPRGGPLKGEAGFLITVLQAGAQCAPDTGKNTHFSITAVKILTERKR